MVHILYNPKSNSAADIQTPLREASACFKNEEIKTVNIVEIEDIKAYFDELSPIDEVVLVGGDGTINVFCNNMRGYEIKNKVYIFKSGTGNDFLRDVCGDGFDDKKILQINDYIENLPVVTVNGKEYLFLNNVGFGIDGMVCTEAEQLLAKGKTSINYTTVAIRLLLTKYKSHKATVTVDGKKHRFSRVWLSPIMNGKYYGGGMNPCPTQDRMSDTISSCTIHSTGALKTLMIFPSIFKGEHVKHTKKVATFSGKEITVEFDVPQAVQIDGEIIRNVTKISAKKYSSVSERDRDVVHK